MPQHKTWHLTIGCGILLLGLSACIDPEQYYDFDGDGFDAQPVGPDCDDEDPRINPNADELCNDLDDNCNGEVDESAIDKQRFFRDADEDGFPGSEEYACPQYADNEGSGLFSEATDCDDLNPTVFPGDHPEICRNGVDDNCDGELNDCGWPEGRLPLQIHAGWMWAWKGSRSNLHVGAGATSVFSADGTPIGLAVLSHGDERSQPGGVYLISTPMLPPPISGDPNVLEEASQRVFTAPSGVPPTDVVSVDLNGGEPELIVAVGDQIIFLPNVRRDGATIAHDVPHILVDTNQDTFQEVLPRKMGGETHLVVTQEGLSDSGSLYQFTAILNPQLPNNPSQSAATSTVADPIARIDDSAHPVAVDTSGDGREGLFVVDLAAPGRVLGWGGALSGDVWRSSADYSVWVEDPEDRVVSLTKAGDVNGDGLDDLAVGVVSTGSDGPNPYGSFFMITGLGATGSMFVGQAAMHLEGSHGHTTGYTMAAVGDVNRDGFSDYLVGACDELYGHPKALLAHGWSDTTGSNWTLSATSFGNELAEDTCEGFEVEVVGDITGDLGVPDGLQDWIITLPDYVDPRNDPDLNLGAAFLLLGTNL